MYILSSKNIYNLISLTASDEVSTFEAAKLQNPLSTARWRSTNLTPNIVGQFASAITLDSWGLYYSNAETGDEMRLRLATTEANLTNASELYDSGVIGVWPGTPPTNLDEYSHVHSREEFASIANVSWFRIDLDFTGNANSYVELGAIFADARLTFASVNPKRGFAHGQNDRAVYESNYAAGGLGRGGGSTKRSITVEIEISTQAEFYNLKRLLRDRRTILPVALVIDETEDAYPLEYIYYGYIDSTSIPEIWEGRFVAPVTIIES